MIKDFEAADVYLLAGLCFFANGHWICGIICTVIFLIGVILNVQKRAKGK